MEGRLRWEWHLWKIRWLAFLLMGAEIWYHAGQHHIRVYPLIALLILLTVSHSFLLWRWLRGRHRAWYPLLSLSGDVLLITLGVSATGWDTPLVFLYVLPLISASLWYGTLAFLTCYLLIFIGNASAGGWLLPDESGQVQLGIRLALLGVLAFAGAFLTHEGQRRVLELTALQRIAQTMRSVSDRQEALQQLVTGIRDILNAEKVLFLLHDKSSEQLVAQPPAAGITDEELNQTRVPRGEGVSWHVFTSGQPYLSRDAKNDPIVSRRFAQMYGARSMLSVPLQVNDQTIGVIHALNKRNQIAFTSEDCQLLLLVGSQIALILATSQLHDDLQRERTLLNAILHSIASGVLVTNAQDEILLMNPSAAHLLRVAAEEAQGRALASVIAEPPVVSLLERAWHSSETVTEEVTLPQSGNTVVRVDCTPVMDKNGKILGQVAVFHDITEWRRLEQMKSEFISSVSHELRTPLTSIKAFAATLLRDVEFDRATQREFLGIINSQCDRLSRTINDLLQLSRIESGRPLELHYTTVDVCAVVQRVVRSESLFTSKHRFETNIKPDAAFLEADEEKLARILTNLVNNAVKYSPDGGVVTISASAEPESLLFAVSDEGIGIPENERTAIFEKFYQIDGSRTRRMGGSGVGLFLAKQLVDAHGGEIWIESEVARGATFFFRLPRRRPARARPSQSEMSSASPEPLPQTANRR